MSRIFNAWDVAVFHTPFATLDDWFFLLLSGSIILAIVTPVARRIAR
jgi:hypothetical protein